MTKISEIQPDVALKKALDGKIEVHTSEADTEPVKVYQHAERPDTGLDEQFIDITVNGVVRAMTHPLGVFRGNLAVAVYVKTKSDGSVKRNRENEIISQLEEYLKYNKHGRYFFEITAGNVITPTSVNVTSGYSVTVLNVEWRMDEAEESGSNG